MLLNRDYVGHMASEVVKKLIEDKLVEIKEKDLEPVITRVRLRMMEEITVEDKVNPRPETDFALGRAPRRKRKYAIDARKSCSHLAPDH